MTVTMTMNDNDKKLTRAVVLAVAGTLAACASGPDFRPPAQPDVARHAAAAMPGRTIAAPTVLGDAQRFDTGRAVDPAWWRELGSPRLDAWIAQAFVASPTLAATRATLRQARESFAAQAGATEVPQVTAGFAAQRQRANTSPGQADSARTLTLYSPGIDLYYEPDLAGGNRRALEALAARADVKHHELDGARLALAANIAATAIARARLAAQIAATQAMIGAQEEQVALAFTRWRLGQAAQDDVLPLQTQLEQARAGLPQMEKQLEQSEHLLAILAGQAPGAAHVPDFTLGEFRLPVDLPVVLPSELVRRRPDIRAAEALLHAANAEYGVAVAKLYPQLELSAGIGAQALSTGALFGGGAAVWNVLGQLTQPLFRPGLPAAKRASLAALDAAAASYQGVVLDALRGTADALRALDHDARALAALAAADAAAQRSLESIERQVALGTAAYVQLLVAQQQAQLIRLDLVAGQAQRLADSVALFQAMGGGT